MLCPRRQSRPERPVCGRTRRGIAFEGVCRRIGQIREDNRRPAPYGALLATALHRYLPPPRDRFRHPPRAHIASEHIDEWCHRPTPQRSDPRLHCIRVRRSCRGRTPSASCGRSASDFRQKPALSRFQGSDGHHDCVAVGLGCDHWMERDVCGRAWVVVRSRAGRPMPSAMARSSATVFSEPCSDPAIREMVSSIRVPPRSLAPPCNIT